MITTETLDVTKIVPKLKHPTIFQHFDALEAGEAFTILNDHDPMPLYYQLLGERGNIFTWQYLQEGPEWWRVRIAKPAAKANEATVGEIAAKDMRKAEVFKKFGIDFCCGGRKTLKEACSEAGVSAGELETALKQAEQSASGKKEPDYSSWEPDFLANYIVNIHHSYIKENAPIIEQLAQKVASAHGANHPELKILANGVRTSFTNLLTHLEKEEKVLFPFIRDLVWKKMDSGKFAGGLSIAAPIHMMESEHEETGSELAAFRELTGNYTLPADACNSYAYLFHKLEEFESDLHRHIHLENNILFPKVIALEKELTAHAN